MTQLFDYKDYRLFFKDRIASDPRKWGMKSKLAIALNSQTGFVSQVLQEKAHFSSDHVLKAARFFSLEHQECDFLLLLEQFQKAGTRELKNHLEQKIERLRIEKAQIQPKTADTIPIQEATEVFGDPVYILLMVALSCAPLQSIQALSDRFNMEGPKLLGSLQKLEQFGLIEKTKSFYQLSEKASRLHFPKSSPLSAMHLMNWRLEARKHFQEESSRNYTVVCGASQKDADQIQSLIRELTKKIDQLITNTDEEEVFCFNLDFFKV